MDPRGALVSLGVFGVPSGSFQSGETKISQFANLSCVASSTSCYLLLLFQNSSDVPRVANQRIDLFFISILILGIFLDLVFETLLLLLCHFKSWDIL